MKLKLNKKNILTSILSVASLAVVVSVISVKVLNPYRPAFYSYSAYADNETINEINKKYSYKEYGSFNEFEYVVENNKAIAGVASDYSVMNMIKNGQLAPISKSIEKINNLDFTQKQYIDYFTYETKEQISFFDSILEKDEKTQNMLNDKYKDEYGENYVYKFSDFIVPYFINDRVFAFNTKKLFDEVNMSENPLNFDENEGDITDFLQTIFNSNPKSKIKIQWTKNEIENVVFGSEYNGGNFDTSITDDNYEELLDNFSKIIKDGTQKNMNDLSTIIFEPDSDVILNNLIDPSYKINLVSLYNGDALDAYYGHDNFQETNDGDRVRIVRTKNNIRILDSFVLSSKIDEQEKEKALIHFNQYLFHDMFESKEYFEQKEDPYDDFGIMKLFDYVNYTPSALGAFEFIDENYFLDEETNEIDEMARNIFRVSKNTKTMKVLPIQPITQQVYSNLKIEFQKKIN